jgi:hypothetical protein
MVNCNKVHRNTEILMCLTLRPRVDSLSFPMDGSPLQGKSPLGSANLSSIHPASSPKILALYVHDIPQHEHVADIFNRLYLSWKLPSPLSNPKIRTRRATPHSSPSRRRISIITRKMSSTCLKNVSGPSLCWNSAFKSFQLTMFMRTAH